MLVSRLEALAEAFTEYSGYRDVQGKLYQLRNPGGLHAYDPVQMRDLDNYRGFTSFKGGFQALIFDLERKCSGNSHTKLEKESKLRELVVTNGFQHTVTGYVVKFLRKALDDTTIDENTPIGWFLA